jgi:hypothetical protein
MAQRRRAHGRGMNKDSDSACLKVERAARAELLERALVHDAMWPRDLRPEK